MRTDVIAFRMDDLDTDLLTVPAGTPTNWHVIAGVPSCGKTTLIERLAAQGFRVIPESARAYIERAVSTGRTIDEIHRNGADLQRELADLQANVEAELSPEEVLFLDGALPLSLAWYRAFGLDPNEIVPKCLRHRYASVFLLDALPLDVDEIRFDDSRLVPFLDHWIADDFTTLGYDVVRVPVLPPEARLAFVLHRLEVDHAPHALARNQTRSSRMSVRTRGPRRISRSRLGSL